nr:MAG TPA: hypothetical protein [Caudoviricetes sp.]
MTDIYPPIVGLDRPARRGASLFRYAINLARFDPCKAGLSPRQGTR